MNLWIARAAVLLALLATGWAAGRAVQKERSPRWGPRNGRIRVLTTIFPLYDFARTIGGSAVDVRNLLPPGVDPHEYALSPADVALVANSDLLIMNGQLDEFLREALQRAGTTTPIVECAPAVSEGYWIENDPHLWLDPSAASIYALTIARALEPRLPRDAAGVDYRAAKLQEAISALDQELSDGLAPLRGRGFITFHNAFAYLARRYGLTVAGVWQSTPGREPAPREVEAILTAGRSQNVRSIFTEPGFSPRALEMVAADSRLPVFELDPAETAEDFDRTSYVEIMRKNLKTLRRALR